MSSTTPTPSNSTAVPANVTTGTIPGSNGSANPSVIAPALNVQPPDTSNIDTSSIAPASAIAAPVVDPGPLAAVNPAVNPAVSTVPGPVSAAAVALGDLSTSDATTTPVPVATVNSTPAPAPAPDLNASVPAMNVPVAVSTIDLSSPSAPVADVGVPVSPPSVPASHPPPIDAQAPTSAVTPSAAGPTTPTPVAVNVSAATTTQSIGDPSPSGTGSAQVTTSATSSTSAPVPAPVPLPSVRPPSLATGTTKPLSAAVAVTTQAPSTSTPSTITTTPAGSTAATQLGSAAVTGPAWFQFTCADLTERQGLTPNAQDPNSTAFQVFAQSALLWPNNSVIRYSFTSGNALQQAKVDKTVVEWSNYSNVTFTKVASGGDIKITFDTTTGSWSYVGTQNILREHSSDNDVTMNLGWVDGTNTNLSDADRGTILHEFGHVLGLTHEFLSVPNPGGLQLDPLAASQFYITTQGMSSDQFIEQILNVYNAGNVTNYSKVDPTSIMQYFMTADLNQQRKAIPPNPELSETDKAYMFLNYPSFKPNITSGWNLERAMNVVGIRGRTRERILQTTSLDTIRQQFALWRVRQMTGSVEEEPERFDDGLDSRSHPAWFQKTCADLAQRLDPSPIMQSPEGAAHAVFAKETNLWDVGTVITYSFIGGLARQQAKVNTTVSEWMKYTNITFERVNRDGDIRIDFVEDLGSYSFVGRDNLSVPPNEQTMNLGWVLNGAATTEEERGVILHEFGHVLGLLHEHQSPARAGGITLDEAAVYEYYTRTQGWSRAEVKEQIIDVYNREAISNYSRFDSTSIMEYFMPPEMNIEHIDIPPNVELSDLDKAYAFLNYPRLGRSTLDPPGWSLTRALDIAGVDGDHRSRILAASTEREIRRIFNEWNASVKAVETERTPLPGRRGVDEVARGGRTQPRRGERFEPARAASSRRDEFATRASDRTNVSGEPRITRDVLGRGGKAARGVNPAPARGAANPQNATDATAAPATPTQSGNFLQTMIDTLKKFFNPGGGQIFTLQFPGRFLQISEYAWDTSSAGIYGQFIKPVAVNESEFRLVDQLYDVASVVAAPNGVSLSQTYEQLLNNLLPIFSTNGLARQQAEIRRWLLQEVTTSRWVEDLIQSQHRTANIPITPNTPPAITAPTIIPDASTSTGPTPAFAVSNKLTNGNKITRMELSNALMEEYLQAKQAWELERDSMIQQALQLQLGSEESAEALNNLTRTLAHTTTVRQAQLAAKYADAVVRGFSHNVRDYLGYLDIQGSAESLQDAKDALREAAMSSLDGSLQVYPIQMNPVDWFEGLNTSFTLEDLTSDPDLILQQIDAKSTQLDLLNTQLVALQFGSTGDPVALREQLAIAQATLDGAQSALASKYTSNTLAMVKTCIDKTGEVDPEQVLAVGTQLGLADRVINLLQSDLEATAEAQRALTSASRAYSQGLAGLALAEATDTRQQQEEIRIRIESTKRDLDQLTARYQQLNLVGHRPMVEGATQTVAEVELFPSANNDTAGGSRWQEITMRHEVKSSYSNQSTKSSGSSSAATCNLFFLSGSTSSSASESMAESATLDSTNLVEVGFRATLVTVDRAGWFRPQFFKQSGSYYHINPTVSWSKWPAGITTMERMKDGTQSEFNELNRFLMPAYPVGYIICKDITIKIFEERVSDVTFQRRLASTSAASGGVLCFSYSSSKSSSESENTHNFIACSDGCVIRIPGPQILGYIMQLTENDTTQDMPANLPPGFFIPDEEFDAATGAPAGPARGIQGPAGPRPGMLFDEVDAVLRKAGVSATTMETVQAAMRKELDGISREIAERVVEG